jgi:hypothetical protein
MEIKTLIYNCKRCKVGRKVEYPEKSSFGYGRRDADGKYISAGAWIMACGGGKPTEYGGDPLGLCPQCGRLMSYGELKGTFAPVPCDARCTGARGHNCECSCGGANHGKNWSAA